MRGGVTATVDIPLRLVESVSTSHKTAGCHLAKSNDPIEAFRRVFS